MRKRRLGGSSALPETLRHYFTEGERAVLCIIAFEMTHHGVCDISIDEIADRAGVGRTTVQNALHEARRLGLIKITERPVRGKKSLTNLVDVASHEWKVWIKRAPSPGRPIGSKLFKSVNTSKNIDLRRQEPCNEEDSADPVPWIGSAGQGSG
jgi:DNA-binding transcriptional MocR family regulator